jgi:hypothetical protein
MTGAHGFRRNHERSVSRQGVSMDSNTMPADIFDTPCRRSTKMMGTSPMRAPRRAA